jgi:hypothetical protein
LGIECPLDVFDKKKKKEIKVFFVVLHEVVHALVGFRQTPLPRRDLTADV